MVVDNGSTDGSVHYLTEEFPDIEIVENGVNLGYTGGNNVGIRRAIEMGAQYVLLLNNDTIVEPAFLRELVEAANRDKCIGVVGPTVLDYASTGRIQATGAIVRWNTGTTTRIEPENISNNGFEKGVDVDFVSGSCLLARTEMIDRIGLLDECYFAHWEEIDWCIGARNAGYRVLWVPKARIWHKCGASGGRVKGFREYQNGRNRLWFMKKRASPWQFGCFLLYFFCYDFWIRIAILLCYYRDKAALYGFLKGTFDGLSKFPCR
jgi:hypothetical protein